MGVSSNGCDPCFFQHHQHFLQCNTSLSHSHSPMRYTATSSPPNQVTTAPL